MLYSLLALASFAATTDTPTVSAWTARTLRFGEFAVGTGSVLVSPAPHVQLGTAPVLDLARLPNGRIRVAPLETHPVALAIDGAYTRSAVPRLEVTAIEAGTALSLHAGRFDLHGGGAYVLTDLRAAPDLARSPLEGAAVRDERVIARGALEVRATDGGSVVATAGFVPWGRGAGTALHDPISAIYAAGALGEAPVLEESWWGTLGWQHTAGLLTVRAAVGWSAQPWVWLRDALSLQVRFGPGARPHAVATEDDDRTDGSADGEPAGERAVAKGR